LLQRLRLKLATVATSAVEAATVAAAVVEAATVATLILKSVAVESKSVSVGSCGWCG